MTKPGFRKTRDDVFGLSAATTLKSAQERTTKEKAGNYFQSVRDIRHVVKRKRFADDYSSPNPETIPQFLCSSPRWHWTYDTSSKRFCDKSNAWHEDAISWWNISVSSMSSRNTKRSIFLARCCKISWTHLAWMRATRNPIANSHFLFEWLDRTSVINEIAIYLFFKSGK